MMTSSDQPKREGASVRRNFGAFKSGLPDSANNERIDALLAAEAANDEISDDPGPSGDAMQPACA